ncbi:MAG: bifunctional UDP-N-acetylglucosamine diphosphorylase/glucosamine-1-phosphate N-acetyltransferase GlmU [Rickettsiales bacterium]|jgi:bifunctional UDP-N-acetylglucosamine pyrophosphorylase/glucosamine-1-phosphate N-acetyltransferase|nr:bifunctional UDP-N-acetylglucosamine diphosphorylase/glucosamine-1-phosphate N-acetyltransferase GlmU [Rickettsiales bacterium]
MSTSIIILAAGQSTRMNSKLPKVLHPIAERPALGYILDTATSSNPNQIILVTSPDMDEVRAFADNECSGIAHVIQEKPLGTANAVKHALPHLDSNGETIILYGDTPFVTSKTLSALKNKITSAAIVAFHCYTENRYGRLVTYEDDLLEIVEYNDATPEEKSVTLCNSGIYSIKNEHLHKFIPLIKNSNSKKEFYLTDIVKLISQKDITCSIIETSEKEVMGFNTREDLSKAQDIMQENIKSLLMNQGVSIINPKSSYIAYDFQAGKDVTIYPNVFIGRNVSIGDNVQIRSFSHLEGVKIGHNSSIGPFARIRPKTEIASDTRIGNFVEIKNSQINNNSKVNHLSYIGDSEIGQNCNIGAGTITCNFDGIKTKSKTTIGDQVCIGSNSALIAPITINNGAFIAAGSVVTEDVAEDELCIARAKQTAIKKWRK